MPQSSDSAAGPRETIARGNHLALVRDGQWEYAERIAITGVIAIVAVTGEGKLLLTEQYRRPLRARVIELPAGLCGDDERDADEDMPTAAIRELREETGYRAAQMQWLTEGPSSPGMSNEVITFFRAHGLRKEGAGGGLADESIRVHEIALADVQGWLRGRADEGFMIDPLVYTGLFFLTQGL